VNCVLTVLCLKRCAVLETAEREQTSKGYRAYRMRSVGIIGGGIGGVAAAAAFHESGIRATVYEQAPRLEEVGAGMMLWPNATRALKRLGLLDEVAARSGHNTHFLVRANSGKILMNIALGNFDVPALCTRRSDLLASLLSAAPRESIQLGRKFTHLEQSRSGVRVHFAGGGVEEHDAVIGADGIRSRVRAQLFGVSDPIHRGYTIWRGVAAYSGRAVHRGFNSETWGPGSRFGILDVGQGRFTWYATANVSKKDGGVQNARKQELLQSFGGWHEPIRALIESTELILENGAYDLAPLAHWTMGRVTLLGDAAHPCTPNLGQGGCMALEDALVLAKCVSSERSVETALRRYESLRRNRTRHIQRRSLVMGHIGQWENRAVVAGRRVVTSLLPAALFEHNLRRVYSYEA
jgi:2-polyprenyl-6-methoxyphenol hydroxylase-like FAD-dependent oxidoreductase